MSIRQKKQAPTRRITAATDIRREKRVARSMLAQFNGRIDARLVKAFTAYCKEHGLTREYQIERMVEWHMQSKLAPDRFLAVDIGRDAARKLEAFRSATGQERTFAVQRAVTGYIESQVDLLRAREEFERRLNELHSRDPN